MKTKATLLQELSEWRDELDYQYSQVDLANDSNRDDVWRTIVETEEKIDDIEKQLYKDVPQEG